VIADLITTFLAQGQPAPAPPPPPPSGCNGGGPVGLGCSSPSLGSRIIGGIVGSGIDAVAESFTRSVQPFLTGVFTFWMNVPAADVASPTGPVQMMQGSLHWVTAAIAVGALAIGATRLVLTRRPDNAVALGRSMGLLLFAAVIAVPLFNLLLNFGDEFSTWILNRAAGGSFANTFVAFLTVSSLTPLGTLAMILVALAAVLGGFVQMVFLFIRNAVLLVILGVYPMAASASSTPTGQAWFQKQTGWIVAFVFFKPAASIVYATAFVALRDNSSDINVLLGVVLILVACLALPALMRVAAPLTAMAGGGGGGLGGLAGAAGALATGAIAWQGRSSGGGSGPPAASLPAAPTGVTASPSSPATGAGAGAGASGATPGGAAASGAGAGTTGGGAGGAAAGGAAAKAAAAAGGPAGAALTAAKMAGAAAQKFRRSVDDAAGGGPSGAGGDRG
jgi:type IV secretion system protein TrbL